MATEAPSIESRIEAHLFGAEDQAEEVSDQVESNDDDQSSDEEVEQRAPTVEEVEIEVEGWKGKIPQALKAELDKAADYTRKSQEVADQKRLVDSQRRIEQENQAFYKDASQEFDQLRQIEAQLEQYKKVDLSSVDGETLSRMSMAAANLREERAKLKESLDSKRGEFKTKVVSAWDDMASKAHEAVTRSLPDWDKNAGKVAQYAIDQGFPFEVITGYDRSTRERVGPGVVDPTFAKTLYKAWRYDQLQSGKSTQLEKTKGASPILKPGASDTRSEGQVSQSNLRKALNAAQTPGKKAQVLGDHTVRKLEKLGLFK